VRPTAERALRLTLTSVEKRQKLGRLQRSPFSIVFQSPSGRSLTQDTYRVEHKRLGKFALFLVPIGPGDRTVEFEAVFG
jgi:hypothetical protein